jgi:hypothetical protein
VERRTAVDAAEPAAADALAPPLEDAPVGEGDHVSLAGGVVERVPSVRPGLDAGARKLGRPIGRTCVAMGSRRALVV